MNFSGKPHALPMGSSSIRTTSHRDLQPLPQYEDDEEVIYAEHNDTISWNRASAPKPGRPTAIQKPADVYSIFERRPFAAANQAQSATLNWNFNLDEHDVNNEGDGNVGAEEHIDTAVTVGHIVQKPQPQIEHATTSSVSIPIHSNSTYTTSDDDQLIRTKPVLKASSSSNGVPSTNSKPNANAKSIPSSSDSQSSELSQQLRRHNNPPPLQTSKRLVIDAPTSASARRHSSGELSRTMGDLPLKNRGGQQGTPSNSTARNIIEERPQHWGTSSSFTSAYKTKQPNGTANVGQTTVGGTSRVAGTNKRPRKSLPVLTMGGGSAFSQAMASRSDLSQHPRTGGLDVSFKPSWMSSSTSSRREAVTQQDAIEDCVDFDGSGNSGGGGVLPLGSLNGRTNTTQLHNAGAGVTTPMGHRDQETLTASGNNGSSTKKGNKLSKPKAGSLRSRFAKCQKRAQMDPMLLATMPVTASELAAQDHLEVEGTFRDRPAHIRPEDLTGLRYTLLGPGDLASSSSTFDLHDPRNRVDYYVDVKILARVSEDSVFLTQVVKVLIKVDHCNPHRDHNGNSCHRALAATATVTSEDWQGMEEGEEGEDEVGHRLQTDDIGDEPPDELVHRNYQAGVTAAVLSSSRLVKPSETALREFEQYQDYVLYVKQETMAHIRERFRNSSKELPAAVMNSYLLLPGQIWRFYAPLCLPLMSESAHCRGMDDGHNVPPLPMIVCTNLCEPIYL